MTIEPRWQTDGIFDVYKLLDEIRARPRMYLDEESLTKLWWLIQGYEMALRGYNPTRCLIGVFHGKFYYYVKRHFHLSSDENSSANMILKHCAGDEAQALAKFFELLDEFRRQEK